jgi:hypothetical protein
MCRKSCESESSPACAPVGQAAGEVTRSAALVSECSWPRPHQKCTDLHHKERFVRAVVIASLRTDKQEQSGRPLAVLLSSQQDSLTITLLSFLLVSAPVWHRCNPVSKTGVAGRERAESHLAEEGGALPLRRTRERTWPV